MAYDVPCIFTHQVIHFCASGRRSGARWIAVETNARTIAAERSGRTTADRMLARSQRVVRTSGRTIGTMTVGETPIALMRVAARTTGTTTAVGITTAETGTTTAETTIDETGTMIGETAGGMTTAGGTMTAGGSAALSASRRGRSAAGTTWARTRRTRRCCCSSSRPSP